jgi:membrane protease YdiL (CAAX protease family)
MLFVFGIVGAGVVVVTMDAIGLDAPTSAVAELTEDAVGGGNDDGELGAGTAENPDDGSGITVWIVIVAVLAATAVPLIEELGYRGLWYSALVKRGHSEWWAIVVSSFVFAIVHLEPTRTPIIFVLGMVLGWGRKLTNRIGASVIAHGIINGLAFVALLTSLS